MKKLKLGILGAGPRATCILSTYAKVPFVDVRAICDRADGLADAAAAGYCKESGNSGVKTFYDYEEMMRNRNFDALLVTEAGVFRL